MLSVPLQLSTIDQVLCLPGSRNQDRPQNSIRAKILALSLRRRETGRINLEIEAEADEEDPLHPIIFLAVFMTCRAPRFPAGFASSLTTRHSGLTAVVLLHSGKALQSKHSSVLTKESREGRRMQFPRRSCRAPRRNRLILAWSLRQINEYFCDRDPPIQPNRRSACRSAYSPWHS